MAHSPKALNRKAYQKTDLALAKLIRSIIYPEIDQRKPHWEDQKTKWFGAFRDEKSRQPYFHDFGQYNRLITGMRDNQYPSLSSFIGETRSGKSTLINALITVMICHFHAQLLYVN
jgi:ribosome biogenesis GTPase A